MPLRKGIPVHYRGSEFFDPLFFFNVSIDSGLKCGLHCVLVILVEPYEPERLMTPRKRAQHFYCPKHRSPVSPEHQLNNGTLIHGLRYGQQATGARNDLQFALCESRVLESKDGGSRLDEAESWSPPLGVQFLGVIHVLSRVCHVLRDNWSIGDYGSNWRRGASLQNPSTSPGILIENWPIQVNERYGNAG
jgi:hypothetical protein